MFRITFLHNYSPDFFRQAFDRHSSFCGSCCVCYIIVFVPCSGLSKDQNCQKELSVLRCLDMEVHLFSTFSGIFHPTKFESCYFFSQKRILEIKNFSFCLLHWNQKTEDPEIAKIVLSIIFIQILILILHGKYEFEFFHEGLNCQFYTCVQLLY